jgi:hypothetical protein
VKWRVAPVVATTLALPMLSTLTQSAMAVSAMALMMLLPATQATAATVYISDDLVLGVYAEQSGQGQRLATLHSGATLDTIAVNGEFTQVRLSDGTVGWVKSTYLTTREPAAVRVKELEEEMDRRHATTPELAEAAAHTELTQLKRDLAAKQAELDAALAAPRTATPGVDAPRAAVASGLRRYAPILAAAVSLAVGFWMGYATLARRIKRKYGGIKVY